MEHQDDCPTTQIEVQPGDETGIYHITFCNLPFNATWQDVKDWLGGIVGLDEIFVEVFPLSCSGWVSVEGEANFEAVSAYMKTVRLQGRPLIFDDRNKSEPVIIRVELTGQLPKHLLEYSCFDGHSQDQSTPSWSYSYGLYPDELLGVGDEATYASLTVETMEFTEFVALLVSMEAAYTPLPGLTTPGSEWTRYHGTNPCASCAQSDGAILMSPSPSGPVLLDSAASDGGYKDDQDDQYDPDEMPGDARERRPQSVPPSFRWK
ncbi:hypothetical protein ACQKWADRAFT_12884 [Trichoderma austrokoningii]